MCVCVCVCVYVCVCVFVCVCVYFCYLPLLIVNSFPLLIVDICLIQITRKFRDEMSPKHGLLRGREFEMKGM